MEAKDFLNEVVRIYFDYNCGTAAEAKDITTKKLGISSSQLNRWFRGGTKLEMWTNQQEEFIKDNYLKMTNREIALNLNRSDHSVKRKIDNMVQKEEIIKRSLAKKVYATTHESLLENEGILKIKELQDIKQALWKDKEIKVRFKISKGTNGVPVTQILKGKIIAKTESFITIKSEHYKESFMYVDFLDKRAIIV